MDYKVDKVECNEAADHWERLAEEQDDWAAWERSFGRYDGVHKSKAVLFRDAAKSLRLTAETGIHHCSCHFIPSTRCPRRENAHGNR